MFITLDRRKLGFIQVILLFILIKMEFDEYIYKFNY
jgi:hypothetical protein